MENVSFREWLAPHPRFVFHFTPASASWLNAVEGFFAKLTRRRLKRGVFRSIVDLQAAINRLIDEANRDPKPFVWTADPDKINTLIAGGEGGIRTHGTDKWYYGFRVLRFSCWSVPPSG